jgi:hypothetical protein
LSLAVLGGLGDLILGLGRHFVGHLVISHCRVLSGLRGGRPIRVSATH